MMRKLIAVLLLLVSIQITAFAGSVSVIIELQQGANASSLARAAGGAVLESIPGTSLYLLTVPLRSALENNPNIRVVSVESNDAVKLRPGSGRLSIMKTPTSRAADW